MRVLCPKCNQVRPGMQVSGDVPEGQVRAASQRLKRVVFVFEGSEVDEFFITPEFASRHGLGEKEIDLPDDYPPWIKDLRVVCGECLSEIT